MNSPLISDSRRMKLLLFSILAFYYANPGEAVPQIVPVTPVMPIFCDCYKDFLEKFTSFHLHPDLKIDDEAGRMAPVAFKTFGDNDSCFTIGEMKSMIIRLYQPEENDVCYGSSTTYLQAFEKLYRFFDGKYKNDPEENNCISENQMINLMRKVRNKCVRGRGVGR